MRIKQLRLHLTLLALLASCAFALSERSMLLLGVSILLQGAVWWFTLARKHRVMKGDRWTMPTALVLALIYCVQRGIADPADLQRAVGGVVLVLLTLRLCARRNVSDERQIILMCGVLLVVSALQSSELFVGLAVVAAGIQAVVCAINLQIVRGTGSLDATHLSYPTSGGSGTHRAQGLHNRHLRNITAFAMASVFGLSVLIFVLFPRNPHPTRTIFGVSTAGASGFSDRISLLNPQRITLSSEQLMVVEWLGPDGKPVPYPGVLRLRGAVLERYDPQLMEWIPRENPQSRFVIAQGGAFQTVATAPVDERFNTYTQRVTLNALQGDEVFSAWVPVGIRCSTPQAFSFSPSTFTIRNLESQAEGPAAGYELRVQPFPSEKTLSLLGRSTIQIPRRATFPVPQVEQIARQILESRGGAEDLVAIAGLVEPSLRWERNRRIASKFEAELHSGNYEYSLDLSDFLVDEGSDPVVHFLTRHRRGHCEYFASALAALCQSVGVDARIVTGFLLSESDLSASGYVVRGWNAHAWVEIRTGQNQWTVFDPTPPADESNQSSPSMWRQVANWFFEPLESVWQESIAQFDAQTQSGLVDSASELVKQTATTAWDAIVNTARSTSTQMSLGPSGYIWLGSVATTITLSTIVVVVVVAKRRHARAALGLQRRDRVRARIALRDGAFYVEALDLLAARGITRGHSQSPASFARAVALENPAAGVLMGEIVSRFYEIRFGARRPDSQRRAKDQSLVERLRAATAIPNGRRN